MLNIIVIILFPLSLFLSRQLRNGIESIHRRGSVQRRNQLMHTDPTGLRYGNIIYQ